MLETESRRHNDNDIVDRKGKNNDIDNVEKVLLNPISDIYKEITEYKLKIIINFMFGGTSKHFGDCTVFIKPAIKQVERFTYIWMSELSEESRKKIINYTIEHDMCTRRPYSWYLNSPVWKYISSLYKIVKNYTCERCGKSYNPAHLVLHHLSYEHIGSELSHPEDVSVLCADCHMIIHGIKEENESER